MMPKPTLQLDEITWGYSKSLLNHAVSIKIDSPDFILLLGENGSGKSTLLRTLGGLIPPVSGNVFFDNIKIINSNSNSQKVAFVFANRPSVEFMRVKDLVLSGFDFLKNPFVKLKPEHLERFEFALNATRISHLKENFINKISDGEFQKAMVARALVQNSKMILLDEPTAFLDYKSKRDLFDLLAHIAKTENKIIIASTHDPDLAQEKGEHFWVIKNKEFQTIRKSDLGNLNLRDFVM